MKKGLISFLSGVVLTGMLFAIVGINWLPAVPLLRLVQINDSYANLIAALANLLLVIVTIVYVYLTYKLLKTQSNQFAEQRRLQVMPFLFTEAFTDDDDPSNADNDETSGIKFLRHNVCLRFANLGVGPAVRVRVETNNHEHEFPYISTGQTVNWTVLLQDLLPKKSKDWYSQKASEFLNCDVWVKPCQFRLKVSLSDVLGNTYTQDGKVTVSVTYTDKRILNHDLSIALNPPEHKV